MSQPRSMKLLSAVDRSHCSELQLHKVLRINDCEYSAQNAVYVSNLLHNFLAKIMEHIRSSCIGEVRAGRTRDIIIICSLLDLTWPVHLSSQQN